MALPFLAILLASNKALGQAERILVDPDKPIAINIDGELLNILVESGSVNRLVVDNATVARLRLKPTIVFGQADLKIGPTKVVKGYNRPLTFSVGGVRKKARVFWLEAVKTGRADGSIGPWGLPQDIVAFRLSGAGKNAYVFPLLGSANSQSYTSFKHDGGSFGLVFAAEDRGRYPVASAAAGAAIAKAYGGTPTDEIWNEQIMFGIERPVRLFRLARPIDIGPFQFTEIAVRIRDTNNVSISESGSTETVSPNDDPAEIVVVGAAKAGPRPVYTFSIGRASLQQCSKLEYIKSAKEIRLHC